MDVYVQFLLHEDDVFELYHLSFNDVAQADITKLAFIKEVFETYAADHGITLYQTEEVTQTTVDTTVMEGLDKFIGDWDVPDVSAWFTLRKDENQNLTIVNGNMRRGLQRSNAAAFAISI